jgi:hypothetical protein
VWCDTLRDARLHVHEWLDPFSLGTLASCSKADHDEIGTKHHDTLRAVAEPMVDIYGRWDGVLTWADCMGLAFGHAPRRLALYLLPRFCRALGEIAAVCDQPRFYIKFLCALPDSDVVNLDMFQWHITLAARWNAMAVMQTIHTHLHEVINAGRWPAGRAIDYNFAHMAAVENGHLDMIQLFVDSGHALSPTLSTAALAHNQTAALMSLVMVARMPVTPPRCWCSVNDATDTEHCLTMASLSRLGQPDGHWDDLVRDAVRAKHIMCVGIALHHARPFVKPAVVLQECFRLDADDVMHDVHLTHPLQPTDLLAAVLHGATKCATFMRMELGFQLTRDLVWTALTAPPPGSTLEAAHALVRQLGLVSNE